MGFFDDTDGLVGAAKVAAGWGILAFDTAALGLAVIAVSALPGGMRPAYEIGRFWAMANLWTLGADLHILGREHVVPGQAYVLMVNHQSHLDTGAVVAALPMHLAYVMKQELRKIPIFGYGCERMGMVYVERGNRESARRSMAEAARRVAAGRSVVFYPEGTRSRDGRLGEFKTGGFRLAIEAQVPILPVSISGTRAMFPPDSWRFRAGRIDIVIGDPISTTGLKQEDVPSLLARTRAAILSGLPREAAGAEGASERG
ncbi:MAG: 1-acyl-sn-glycerol-3-phosphate acyltransferase [Deltaproteobacteria bacterium]|nr:1-acyl-sn-glycerol-3-phosphate acyltransferase [Deltaproteobacteria bacterium]